MLSGFLSAILWSNLERFLRLCRNAFPPHRLERLRPRVQCGAHQLVEALLGLLLAVLIPLAGLRSHAHDR
jgi:hypothetical protein